MAASIPLSVHHDGLLRVLADWSGAGGLYKALAAIGNPAYEREWSPKDVERRAMRILLLECSPILRRWPKSLRAWQDYLPTLSERRRFWSDVPQTKVDWVKTHRRAWPPTSFAIRRRHRSTDQVTLSVLAWTLRRLKQAFDASSDLVGPDADLVASLSADVEQIIARALPMLSLIEDSDEYRPTRDDINAVRAAGWPWNVVADVANVFAALDRGGTEAIARRLLRPEGFPEGVFQLSVLGAVLIGCERMGAKVISLRPIGHLTSGPVYRVETPDSGSWELWCEAANSWTAYGLTDKYQQLASTLVTYGGGAFPARHIRPDILFARGGAGAVVIECKFPGDSLDPGYVAHGLYQAAFYAHQLLPAFRGVLAVAAGPDELLGPYVDQQLGGIRIGLVGQSGVPALIAQVLDLDARDQSAELWPPADFSFKAPTAHFAPFAATEELPLVPSGGAVSSNQE